MTKRVLDNKGIIFTAVLLAVVTLAVSFAPDTLRAQGSPASTQPPPQAAEVGYTKNTFATHLTEADIDFDDSGRPGFRWYIHNPFGRTYDLRKRMIFNSDGTLTMTGGSVWTAAADYSRGRWTAGVAFGGGGYFEAELKFNPDETLSTKTPWWPSFWSVAIEHLSRSKDEQWQGMPSGYVHFTEVDFFEFSGWWKPPQKCCYAGTINDWYGVWNQTCKKGFCVRNNNLSGNTKFKNFLIRYPPEVDFGKFHRYGLLWVPATETIPGYAQYFFDGKPTSGRVTWTKYSDQPPPPGDAPWTFGILDRQHLVINLGTGKDKPLTIRAINVWQSSRDHNLTR
jgi:hypothetical protein